MSNPSRMCPYCGTTNTSDAVSCLSCGAVLRPDFADSSLADGGAASSGTPAIIQCEMIVGFLIPHRCDNVALGRCKQCGRSFCDEHLDVTQQGMVCVACQQGLDKPVAAADIATTYDDSDLILFAAATSWSDDDDRWSLDDDDDLFSDLS